MSISPLFITASTMVNALGCGKKATLDALQQKCSGLVKSKNLEFSTWIGAVEGVDNYLLEPSLKKFN